MRKKKKRIHKKCGFEISDDNDKLYFKTVDS